MFTQAFIQAQIKEKHQSSASLAYVAAELSAQMASDAESVSVDDVIMMETARSC